MRMPRTGVVVWSRQQGKVGLTESPQSLMAKAQSDKRISKRVPPVPKRQVHAASNAVLVYRTGYRYVVKGSCLTVHAAAPL